MAQEIKSPQIGKIYRVTSINGASKYLVLYRGEGVGNSNYVTLRSDGDPLFQWNYQHPFDTKSWKFYEPEGEEMWQANWLSACVGAQKALPKSEFKINSLYPIF